MSAPEPSLPDSPVSLAIAVRFAETDLMGVVHHSAYIVWFEAGRVAWMDAAGLPYTQIAEAGYHFAVTDLACRYRSAARFGDAVEVVTRLAALRSRQVRFEYMARNPDTGALYATGHTQHICVDSHNRMTRIPGWVLEGLRAGAVRLAQQAAHAASPSRNQRP